MAQVFAVSGVVVVVGVTDIVQEARLGSAANASTYRTNLGFLVACRCG